MMLSPRAALSAKSAIRRLRVLTVTTMRQTRRASVRQSRGFVYVWPPQTAPRAVDYPDRGATSATESGGAAIARVRRSLGADLDEQVQAATRCRGRVI